jgi:hypothetical protein
MSRDPKIDRKTLKKNDTFVVKGRQALNALMQERRVIGVGIAGLALLVGGYYAYDAYSTRRLNKDWVAYYQAEEAKGDEQITKLKEAFKSGGNTRGTFMAAVTLGDHYMDAGRRKIEADKVKANGGSKPPAKDAKVDPTKKAAEEEARKDIEPTLTVEQCGVNAAEWYGKALGTSGLLDSERELLTLDQGHALEMQGKWDEAAAQYKSVADRGGQSKPLALIHLGRMHELKQDKEGAKALYKTVAQEFSSSEYATTAKSYLRRMDSALLAPGKP